MLWVVCSRDGKVRFSPVLEGNLENPEPDYRFGPKRSGSGSQVEPDLNII